MGIEVICRNCHDKVYIHGSSLCDEYNNKHFCFGNIETYLTELYCQYEYLDTEKETNWSLLKEKHRRQLQKEYIDNNDAIEKVYSELRCSDKEKQTKMWKVISYLYNCGCSVDCFLDYFEQLFYGDMDWSNGGKNGWHVDHYVPRAFFSDFTQRFLGNRVYSQSKTTKQVTTDKQIQNICDYYKNLRPLPAIENIRKNAKRPDDTVSKVLSMEHELGYTIFSDHLDILWDMVYGYA